MPLFLEFNRLRDENGKIRNREISLDKDSGIANYLNQKKFFQSLSTFDGVQTNTRTFRYPSSFNLKEKKDNRFVFQWNKAKRFGAAMSKEMSNTTLVRLYMLEEKSPHFIPVKLNMPEYQIWKISGNAYDIE